jgi:hypothetical protein
MWVHRQPPSRLDDQREASLQALVVIPGHNASLWNFQNLKPFILDFLVLTEVFIFLSDFPLWKDQ